MFRSLLCLGCQVLILALLCPGVYYYLYIVLLPFIYGLAILVLLLRLFIVNFLKQMLVFPLIIYQLIRLTVEEMYN